MLSYFAIWSFVAHRSRRESLSNCHRTLLVVFLNFVAHRTLRRIVAESFLLSVILQSRILLHVAIVVELSPNRACRLFLLEFGFLLHIAVGDISSPNRPSDVLYWRLEFCCTSQSFEPSTNRLRITCELITR